MFSALNQALCLVCEKVAIVYEIAPACMRLLGNLDILT